MFQETPNQPDARLFLFPLLESLSQGRIIRRSVGILLRILAVLALVAGLVMAIFILKTGFSDYVPASVTFAAILVALCVVAGQVCMAQIALFRARSVENLPDGPFTVIPILSLLLRMQGEGLALWMLSLGVGGCIGLWIAGPMGGGMGMGMLTGFMPSELRHFDSSFLVGLFFLLFAALLACVALLIHYFLAEAAMVLVDAAQNLRRMAGRLPEPAFAQALPSVAMAPALPPPAPKPATTKSCPSCQTLSSVGDLFCETCGSRLG